MHLKSFLIACLFLFRVLECLGQPIDNTASARTISGSTYTRFYYDNDFFTSTDGNYSQGINLEVVNSGLRKFPLSKLLVSIGSGMKKYGIALEHLAYTPTSIRHEEIIYGDRPFAACFYFKTFKLSVDTIRNILFSTTINAGVIGKIAGGEWMQKTIHRNLNNIEPLGWDNQVKNDVILNYDITFEKALMPYRKGIMFSSISKLSLGTLRDNFGTGFSVMAGKFDNPFFTITHSGNDFQCKLYSSALITLIGYDASFQGGLFNNDSPYTIAAKDISRLVLSSEAGITIQFKKLSAEYVQKIISKEFKTGEFHRWGGIRLGWKFVLT